MSTISRSEVGTYQRNGWHVEERYDASDNVSYTVLTKKSTIVDDVRRSVGYIICAPFVLAGSVCLTPCAYFWNADIERSDREYRERPAEQKKPCECHCDNFLHCGTWYTLAPRASLYFYRWAAPFQSTTYTKKTDYKYCNDELRDRLLANQSRIPLDLLVDSEDALVRV